MIEIGVLMVPVTEQVVADLERFGIRRTVAIAHDAPVESFVAARVKGEAATIFASPRRRWADVMEAVRAAAQVVSGGVSLRFYSPDCLIDVRSPLDDSCESYGLCPLFDPREPIEDLHAAVRLKRAVKNGLSDLIGAEMRALAQRIRGTHAAIDTRLAGRAA